MAEVRWERFPLVAGQSLSRRWLQIQADLGLAQNTIEAYGRGLEGYLAFLQGVQVDCETVRREHIAAYVRELLSRPSPKGSKVVLLDSGAGLSNATLQQRITVVRLFYDFLVEEERCAMNPSLVSCHRNK
ncbi:MAG TPA: site-specific integrase [Terriglobales bacterium]